MTEFKNKKKQWIENNPLRRYRKDNNLTQSDVANAIGVSLSTIQFWEQGTNFPDADNMIKLAKLIKKDDLESNWSNWYNKSPKIA